MPIRLPRLHLPRIRWRRGKDDDAAAAGVQDAAENRKNQVPRRRRLFGSYRSAILLLFLILMTGTVVAVVVNSFFRTQDMVRHLSERIVAEVGEKIVNRSSGIRGIAEAHLVSNAAVASATEVIPGRAVLYNMFWQQVVFTPELDSMYIGDADGNFVQARRSPKLATRVIDRTVSPPEERWIYRNDDYEPIARLKRDVEFDPRGRPWYQNTTASRQVRWSDVYLFKTSGKPGVTATYPVLDEQGQIRAVLGTDITLDTMAEFLSQQTIGRHSTVLVLDDNGYVIAHPRNLDPKPTALDEKGLMRVWDMGIPWVADAYAAIDKAVIRSGSGGEVYESVTDGEYYSSRLYSLSREIGLPWKLLIVVAERDLLTAAYRALSESVILSAIILIVALFVVYLIALQFSAPVSRLARNTRMIRDFRFDELRDVRSGFTEIREMDEAIGCIKDAMVVLESQLSTEVARSVVSGNEPEHLQAREMEVPIISSVVDQLGSLFENRSPEEFTPLLRAQMVRGSEIIRREKGTIDTFNGDRLFAFWGAPTPVENGPYRACRAALAMSRCFDRADEKLKADTGLNRHVGLHMGNALVGNVGGEGHIRFSVVGRPVDIALRLRDLNKVYGTRIIVSESVFQETADEFVWRILDRVKISPRMPGFSIYELVANRDENISATARELIHSYELGLSAYRERKWAQAIRFFEQALEHEPGDAAARLLIERCNLLRSGRGGARKRSVTWDGSVMCPSEPSIT
jgi:adenylate cyclase